MTDLNPKYMHNTKIDDLPYQKAGRILREFVERQGDLEGREENIADFVQAYNNVGDFWGIQRIALFSDNGEDLIALVNKILYQGTNKFRAITKKEAQELGLINPW